MTQFRKQVIHDACLEMETSNTMIYPSPSYTLRGQAYSNYSQLHLLSLYWRNTIEAGTLQPVQPWIGGHQWPPKPLLIPCKSVQRIVVEPSPHRQHIFRRYRHLDVSGRPAPYAVKQNGETNYSVSKTSRAMLILTSEFSKWCEERGRECKWTEKLCSKK